MAKNSKQRPRVIVKDGGEFRDLVFIGTELHIRKTDKPVIIERCHFDLQGVGDGGF